MIFKYIILIFLILMCFGAYSSDSCDEKALQFLVDNDVRQRLIKKDFAALQSFMTNPVKIQLYSGFIKSHIRHQERHFMRAMTPEINQKIEGATDCELTNFLGVKEINGQLKVTQLVFNFDKEDLKFSSSGIPSSYALSKFISDINESLDNEDFVSLADSVNYPFLTEDGLEISSPEEFIQNIKRIVTPKFTQLLRNAKDEENFYHHYMGIRLNQPGDIWIMHSDQGLQLYILNSKRK